MKAEAEQNLTAEIADAVASYASDPRQLRRLTRRLRQPETRKHCRQSAKQLLKRKPGSLEAIASLIYCHASGTSQQMLRTALDLAHQRAQGDPAVVDKILTKVRRSMNGAERRSFEALLEHYNAEAAKVAQRQRLNLQSQQRLLQRSEVEANSCDVITVASNEGPYIAEFIHHYLFQGFSSIYIGLNNDHAGATGPIVEAIRAHYPQVHLINTDPEHQLGQQRGSYSRLYEVASRTSTPPTAWWWTWMNRGSPTPSPPASGSFWPPIPGRM